MKERPILFQADMVNAILSGRKTQTRRAVKKPKKWWAGRYDHFCAETFPNEGWWWDGVNECVGASQACPYGKPGDRLWVREAWAEGATQIMYRAGCNDGYKPPAGKWKPSIHMPRWASRITLEIVSVRVERLKDISKIDAEAEGVRRHGDSWKDYLHPTDSHFALDARASFATLWSSINGPGSWDANPWVWVVEFRRVEP